MAFDLTRFWKTKAFFVNFLFIFSAGKKIDLSIAKQKHNNFEGSSKKLS